MRYSVITILLNLKQTLCDIKTSCLNEWNREIENKNVRNSPLVKMFLKSMEIVIPAFITTWSVITIIIAQGNFLMFLFYIEPGEWFSSIQNRNVKLFYRIEWWKDSVVLRKRSSSTSEARSCIVRNLIISIKRNETEYKTSDKNVGFDRLQKGLVKKFAYLNNYYIKISFISEVIRLPPYLCIYNVFVLPESPHDGRMNNL